MTACEDSRVCRSSRIAGSSIRGRGKDFSARGQWRPGGTGLRAFPRQKGRDGRVGRGQRSKEALIWACYRAVPWWSVESLAASQGSAGLGPRWGGPAGETPPWPPPVACALQGRPNWKNTRARGECRALEHTFSTFNHFPGCFCMPRCTACCEPPLSVSDGQP
jgi:hypothetical protein